MSTRVAIVTGAAQGIGRAIALRLVRDGIDIVVNDIPSKAKELDALVADIVALQRKGIAVSGDVSSEADVQNLVDTAVDQLGGLDIMVANAGIGRSTPIISTSAEEWDEVQSINARSVFLCYKAAAIQMIKQGRGGRIIGLPEWGSYCASKFAVRGLTQSAAAEWGKHNITVNAYAPGVVNTPILKDVEDRRRQRGLEVSSVDPTWNVGKPEDVAGLVSYLVNEETGFVTGQSICVNGGMYCD